MVKNASTYPAMANELNHNLIVITIQIKLKWMKKPPGAQKTSNWNDILQQRTCLEIDDRNCISPQHFYETVYPIRREYLKTDALKEKNGWLR